MDLIVKVCDASFLGFCAKGRRKFFAEHGLDYLAFVRRGIPAKKLLALDDNMANRVVEVARNRVSKEGAHG